MFLLRECYKGDAEYRSVVLSGPIYPTASKSNVLVKF